MATTPDPRADESQDGEAAPPIDDPAGRPAQGTDDAARSPTAGNETSDSTEKLDDLPLPRKRCSRRVYNIADIW